MARKALLALMAATCLLGRGFAHGAGQVVAQADTEHDFARFRAETGLTGQGVTVAVFGYAFYGYEAALAQGELPVITFKYRNDAHQVSLGTRLAEIVHDIAPGASIQGYTMLNPASELYADLGEQYWDGSADIALIPDRTYVWPTFANTHPSIAAIEKVIADGTLVVTSADDNRLTHYRGTFQDAGNGFHDFGGGVTAMPIEVPDQCSNTGGMLIWGDDYASTVYSEYFLYLYDPNMNVLEIGDSSGGPMASVGENNKPAGLYYLGIWKDASSPVRIIDLYVSPCSLLGPADVQIPSLGQSFVPEFSISGIGAVSGALAVAALDRGSPEPEPAGGRLFGPRGYSGEGPARLLTDALVERISPHVAATDCQSTFTAPGYQCGSAAAAAVIAGAAALLQEHYRLDRPADLADVLERSALDIPSTGVGYDNRTGNGQVDIWTAYHGGTQVPALSWTGLLALLGGAWITRRR
ncbi:MAG: hypothetical protein HYV63_18020 [Candidatus Schekmanbacteria bacterium]|nr:hypothetical protein [Candidatus Schekmanbacteria bacterium]